MGTLIKKFEVILMDKRVEWQKVLEVLKRNNFPKEISFTVFGDDTSKYRLGSLQKRIEGTGCVWGEIAIRVWGGTVPIPKSKKPTIFIFDAEDPRVDWKFGKEKLAEGMEGFGGGDIMRIVFVQSRKLDYEMIAYLLWHEILHTMGADLHLADETKMGVIDYKDDETIKAQISGFCKWLTANNLPFSGPTCEANLPKRVLGAYWQDYAISFLWCEYITKSCVPGTYLGEKDKMIPDSNEFMAAMKKLPKKYLENYKKLSKLK